MNFKISRFYVYLTETEELFKSRVSRALPVPVNVDLLQGLTLPFLSFSLIGHYFFFFVADLFLSEELKR